MALEASTDIAATECAHAANRRAIEARSNMTHRQRFIAASTSYLARVFRRSCAQQLRMLDPSRSKTSHRKRGLRPKAPSGRRSGRSVFYPRCNDLRRGGGSWTVFLHEQKGCPPPVNERGKRARRLLRLKYHALPQADKERLDRLAGIAAAARKSGVKNIRKRHKVAPKQAASLKIRSCDSCDSCVLKQDLVFKRRQVTQPYGIIPSRLIDDQHTVVSRRWVCCTLHSSFLSLEVLPMKRPWQSLALEDAVERVEPAPQPSSDGSDAALALALAHVPAPQGAETSGLELQMALVTKEAKKKVQEEQAHEKALEARLARMSMAIHEGHEGQTLALAAVEGLLPNPQHADNRLQNALTVPVPAEHAGKELEQLGLWGLRADVQASRSSMSLDTATPAMYMAPLLLARVMRRQAPWEGAPFSDSTGLTEEWETKHSIVSQPFPSPMADRPGGEDGAGQQLQLELDGQRGQAAAAPKNQAKAKAKARAIKVNRSPCWMAGRCVCKAQAAGKMRALRAAKFTRALKSMISADKNKYKELLSKGYVVLAVSCSHRRVAEQPDPLQNKPMDDTPNVHYFHVSFLFGGIQQLDMVCLEMQTAHCGGAMQEKPCGLEAVPLPGGSSFASGRDGNDLEQPDSNPEAWVSLPRTLHLQVGPIACFHLRHEMLERSLSHLLIL